MWNCAEEYKDVNDLCYVRDRLNSLFQITMGMKQSQNMSTQEKLRKLHRNKNTNVIINDTNKNVGPAYADKTDIIMECRRQPYEKVYNKLTQKEANQLIRVVKKRLSYILTKHANGNCSKRESAFLLSNLNKFKIPHFYIIWKFL